MLFLILSVMATWTPTVGSIPYYVKQWMNLQQAQAARKQYLQWWTSQQWNTQSWGNMYWWALYVDIKPESNFSTSINQDWQTVYSVTPQDMEWVIARKTKWWSILYEKWTMNWSNESWKNILSSIDTDVVKHADYPQYGNKSQIEQLKWTLTKWSTWEYDVNVAWMNEEEDKKKQNQLIDLSTKKWTYAWFMKQPWYTPESARKAAVAAMQKSWEKKETTGKTTPIDTSMNVETPVNESNIYDKGREVYKDVNKEKEAAESAIKTSSTSTAWSIKSTEIDAYDNMEKSITSDRDAFVSKLEELQTWFEWTRLWQVRGQIIQWLASRWVNIGQLTPEQIVQLSWDVGSKAFADIHAQKVDTENKIKSAKDLATSKLNELLAKKAISETNYLDNINTINNTYTKNIADLNASYAQSILGIDDKQVAEMKSKTTTALNLLAQIGIPTDQQHLFAGIVAGSKTPEEVMRKIAMTKLTPEQQAAYNKWVEQRNATAKSELEFKQEQLRTEERIANAKIKAEKEMSAEQLANSTLGRGLQLAENYTNMAKAAKDVWDIETSKRYLEAASKIMNSIWTSWGGASTPSP